MELQRFELGKGGLDTGRARDTLGNTIRSRSQIVVECRTFKASISTLYSLEVDFPDSVSAVGSIEGCTVSTVSVSGLTTWTSRRGHKKICEAVITDTNATDTATTEQEAVGAVAMIVQLPGLRERCGDTWHNSSAATPFVPASASSRPCVVYY